VPKKFLSEKGFGFKQLPIDGPYPRIALFRISAAADQFFKQF
jgi:hypothetical protein